MNPKFRSRTNYPVGEPSPVGKPTEPKFSVKLDDEGKKELVETGKKPTYEIVKAALEGSTVRDILNRFTQGDTGALGVDKNAYGDITAMPKTLAEAEQQRIDAEHFFMTLPIDVRRAYDHNLSTFLEAVGNGSFLKNHGVKTGLVSVFNKNEAAKNVIDGSVFNQPQPAAQPVAQPAAQPAAQPLYYGGTTQL